MKPDPEELARDCQDDLYRMAFAICKNPQDAEDVVQTAFVRYLQSRRDFAGKDHARAWLFRTVINLSKNLVTAFWHRNKVSLDEALAGAAFEEPEDRTVLKAVLSLPLHYRIVLHLYYYEGYQVAEIAKLLHISKSAVKNRLLRGRKALRPLLAESKEAPEPEKRRCLS
ncbi:MAG: sigma-70 family RNA polymerase sigma factor [Lachnospiraceae bacterium]|jgi:RNA polymerase sigma-70 factor (ECF subfamily)|nr:sigma-70 family RNA polymerase sigma factor [Lachnospiraceae bacterium]MCI1397195.1 sigma-70 family RNA polymerase sigma factor [Lachnospiraceae bacterium]MCI1423037.1 sigma-70 family RNA polymerase sigma factor [Lachnospiraceae bacterium]MCI1451854.1 sigma-70 family RNA polymerase sigma factor [Lachnospiraceae bacterium]MDD5849579.1 sigma-70 family RNA polymerase sigma factor [Bacillota bacterium]